MQRSVYCSGRWYYITCPGTGYDWEVYFEEEGHTGCRPAGDPIVVCASGGYDEDDCDGGPPPGVICYNMQYVIWYDAETC